MEEHTSNVVYTFVSQFSRAPCGAARQAVTSAG